MTYTAGNYVYSQGYVELPEVRFDMPRPFSVRQDEYNLRASPKIPENADNNILAVYGMNATGLALGEAPGPEGRVWWFVVIDAAYRPLRVWDSYETYAGQVGRPGTGGRYVGWMSSRYLYPLPQIPDTLASPEDWFRYRD